MTILPFDGGLRCIRELNAFCAYDNLSGGQRAMQLVCELERESPEEIQIQPLLWRFDLLADPEWQQLAVADVMRADLLIVSAASCELPTAVRRWLTASLSREIVTHKALVALLGKQGQTVETNLPSLLFLQTVARKGGLAFFAPSPQPAEFHSNRNRIQDQQEMLQTNHGYRHWGINE